MKDRISQANTPSTGLVAPAGPLLLGVPGAAFFLALPLVFWARVYVGAHTPLQALVGIVVGAAFALLFLT